ncbi:hypothetical protein TNCV_302421 [Trichonephila clavipes]|nr:hypothetical protein TNCV_302421 [Trichonephila clavipes]
MEPVPGYRIRREKDSERSSKNSDDQRKSPFADYSEAYLRYYNFSVLSAYCRPSDAVVSAADSCAVRHGVESRRRHGCLQMYSASVAGGTLISRRAASPLVRLVEREERWEDPDYPRVFSLKIGVEPSKLFCHLNGAQSYG